jgi:hypothetical protein
MHESKYFESGPAAAANEIRGSVADLNMEVLQAQMRRMPGLQEQWRSLNGAARLRLAQCPYLLVEAGFARPELWTRLPSRGVHDAVPLRTLLANRSPLPTPLLRRVLLVAWHMAGADRHSARIALGMSGSCAGVVASCRLADLELLAERRPGWIRPRWDQHEEMWRAWLSAAARESPRRLERLQLWGLRMLAAEVRRHSD